MASLFPPLPVAGPNVSLSWYRSPLDSRLLTKLSQRSNRRGLAQTIGWLLCLVVPAVCGTIAVHWLGSASLGFCCLFAYGSVANFSINAMHELGHGRVFESDSLSHGFLRVVSFLGWHHPEMFFASHVRHHRYTLFDAFDLENGPTPVRLSLTRRLLQVSVVDVWALRDAFMQSLRIAFGVTPCGYLSWRQDWEETILPSRQPELRSSAAWWAKVNLMGHVSLALILVLAFRCYIIPLMISFGPFVGGALFTLCNASQHVGLPGNTSDFRACCRTFTAHPFVRFLYWHMNFHTEHHMYPAVPCYRLEALHRVIRNDLPPTCDGLVALWRDICRGSPSRRDFPFRITLVANVPLNPTP